jgi:hypothetical protein
VLAVATLMVLTASFLRLGTTLSREHSAVLDESRAFNLAEAAVSEAIAGIVSGGNGNVASQAQPATIGDGLCWVTATELGGDDHQLDSTGMCNSGRAGLRVVVHITYHPNFNYAVTSDLPMAVGSNFLIDSYDPALGLYASQPKRQIPGHIDWVVNTKGSLGSNSNIALSTNDRIYGDAHPGPGRSVTGVGGNTFATGSTTPSPTPVLFPPVVVPSIPSSGIKLVSKLDPIAARTLGPGSFHYSSLNIGNQAAYTIKGPATVVIDSFMTNPGCSLQIDASAGKVAIYFTGATTWVSNMVVTSTAPSAKSIGLSFSSALPVDLAPNATILGTIYAPLATVSVSSNWVNYGSVSAKAVALSSNVNLHYDESLLASWKDLRPSARVTSWTKRALPANLLASGMDPFQLLRVQRSALPRSSDAHH